MAKPNKINQIQEQIREALEKLREALDEWLSGQQPRRQQQPVPVPVERPYPRRRSTPRY